MLHCSRDFYVTLKKKKKKKRIKNKVINKLTKTFSELMKLKGSYKMLFRNYGKFAMRLCIMSFLLMLRIELSVARYPVAVSHADTNSLMIFQISYFNLEFLED